MRPNGYSFCRPCHNLGQIARNKANYDPAKKRVRHIKYYYGLTETAYNAMLSSQNGGCGLCGKHTTKLVVDHCHTTGKVRSLLCYSCNTGLGQFNDDPSLMADAVAYLERHQT